MIAIDYFEWLRSLIESKYSVISYSKILEKLHNIEFTYIIERDSTRYNDGINMRYRYAQSICDQNDFQGIDEIVQSLDSFIGPCTVLEMMIALALKCEENIMRNPDIGDRVGEWFWRMVVNLGLGGISDEKFDEEYVEYVIGRFLHRQYEPNGSGGLFRLRHCDEDLRKVEIWYQLCWYLNEIT